MRAGERVYVVVPAIEEGPREVAATRETEIGWNTAISTTLIDRVLMAGIEMRVALGEGVRRLADGL